MEILKIQFKNISIPKKTVTQDNPQNSLSAFFPLSISLGESCSNANFSQSVLHIIQSTEVADPEKRCCC